MARAGAPEGPLFKPRYLAAAEVPLPEGIAEADYVVVGKVVGVEDKTVSASPYPGSPAKIATRRQRPPSEMLSGSGPIIPKPYPTSSWPLWPWAVTKRQGQTCAR